MSEREIIEVEPEARPADPLAMIDRAVSAGYRGEELRCLYDLYRQWTADTAAQKFSDAITKFQAECPPICKRRQASSDKLQFDYASYDDVDRVARPLMARYGIVATYTTEPSKEPPGITVTCRIRVGIHQEPTTLTVPIPQGKVNATQLMGQAVTYAKRYALCAALNIVITDEDTDGALTGARTLDEAQLTEINGLIEANVAKGRGTADAILRGILGIYLAESLDGIPASKHRDIVQLLKIRLNGGAK